MGSIVGFTDPQGNTRRYTYDSLQRMLSVDDPNVGDVQYTYDDVGNLVERVDALGQTQEFVYGKANRLLSAHMKKDAHGAEDYSYEYHYDEPKNNGPLSDGQNLLGKLAWVKWPTGTHHVSYNELGQLTEEAQTLWDGTTNFGVQNRDTFSQTYKYNAAGELLSQELPGGLHLAFDYNERSLVSGVYGGLGKDTRAIFDGIKYDHRGATLRTDMRNGTSTCSWYDNRARLSGTISGPSAEVSCDEDPEGHNPAAFQHLRYKRTPTGLIKKIEDLAPKMNGLPRFEANYRYDRLYQLTEAVTPAGAINYTYDTIQNLTSRTADPSPFMKNLPTGEFGYGERGAGPNQITSAGNKRFEYNAIGQMKEYNGFDLYFDVESRLVKAKKPGYATIEYHYDDTGEKKLTIIKKPGEKKRIYRYVSGGYQIRDGKETWFVSGGHGQAEISKAEGLEVDLYLLDEMARYFEDPQNTKKPLPAEYMDLDGDDDFDEDDYEIAKKAYWNGELVGKEAEVWRYYHKDHLGGSTVVTDSMGDVVSAMRYHPYGEIAERYGQKPIFGFAGGEIEEEQELGLVRFGARWYAPDIGRWVSGDSYLYGSPGKSVENSLQAGLYSYGVNNPANNIDPSGFQSEESDADNAISAGHESLDSGEDESLEDALSDIEGIGDKEWNEWFDSQVTTYHKIEMTEFNQYDPRWGSISYGRKRTQEEISKGEHKRTIGTSGCHATSVAMILNYYSQQDGSGSSSEITPADVAGWYDSTVSKGNGRKIPHYYITGSWDPAKARIAQDFPRKYGYELRSIAKSEVAKSIKSGVPVMFSCGRSKCTGKNKSGGDIRKGSHFMVLNAYDEETSSFEVLDPGRNNDYDPKEMHTIFERNLRGRFYVIVPVSGDGG